MVRYSSLISARVGEATRAETMEAPMKMRRDNGAASCNRAREVSSKWVWIITSVDRVEGMMVWASCVRRRCRVERNLVSCSSWGDDARMRDERGLGAASGLGVEVDEGGGRRESGAAGEP